MSDILQITDYPSIRYKMGITINDFPDLAISSIGFLPVAEAMVEDLVTDWAAIMTAGGRNKLYLQAATMCLICALFVNPLELQRGQSFHIGDYSESETRVAWDEQGADYLEECKSYLNKISTHQHVRRTLLIGAGPTSGYTTWPTVIDQWSARLKPHIIQWLWDQGVPLFTWENMP